MPINPGQSLTGVGEVGQAGVGDSLSGKAGKRSCLYLSAHRGGRE